ncbi:MAG: tRNA (adenosine(37)-N6)-threonylcarbamoyltransferase complex ATPase subunit type 1 TsaE [Candidatus Latescibacteria bacterium]|nr:tRNA (adenosine(37)-N6)-threonylcarbamoyltransferase complex ATPase subunit type 1 TsaE [Candidatus Latescibacterota bacterium]NIM22325.1 tRNA (adenosine(37)-N6)-threonylcarbamoyltransferase complex ATPase subunit type 1 TsaE [Candidatus Latescibacterota bacterium]NIM66154.1 tRNA (adenosine(37)-N6)-threonylcarbamoyltransferase complex ATPase subunit type 1 TsaE [Candidatus Latescibacterota bacterium]NIO02562.1 tRNA (adenosine(37)-N6)-threonylcarbamoyltransferase complex ATPase subunit type 1 
MPVERTGIFNICTASESETEIYGRELGLKINSSFCISLVGALGSGKTVLARGLCRGLGVDEEIISPTFILYEEFRGRLPVIHVDLYRLEHESEIEELGVFEKLRDKCVIIAEWGDRSDMILNASDIVITLRSLAETKRDIMVGYSGRARALFR